MTDQHSTDEDETTGRIEHRDAEDCVLIDGDAEPVTMHFSMEHGGVRVEDKVEDAVLVDGGYEI